MMSGCNVPYYNHIIPPHYHSRKYHYKFNIDRFQVSDTHPERLDMMMFVGGPAWALEWCPLPDGATGNQYLAVACHQGMDNQHVFNQTYAGHGLIQLWDMGRMNYSSR